jgi:outer membrane lipoprotein-sorting protein
LKASIEKTSAQINKEYQRLMQQMKQQQAAARRRSITAILIGLSLFLGISTGAWALTAWLSNSIKNKLETRATLSQQIEQQQQTLTQFKAQTWGLVLHKAEDGARFIVLPAGVQAVTGWTIGNKNAVKFVKE